jgi:hypothetical protein
MKLILAFALLFAVSANAQTIEQIVESEIIRDLSQGWEDDRFPVSSNDVWGIFVGPSDMKECASIASGYARRYTYDGSYTVKFWVCVTKDSEAYVLDYDFTADQ